jgi:hypothetical protein
MWVILGRAYKKQHSLLVSFPIFQYAKDKATQMVISPIAILSFAMIFSLNSLQKLLKIFQQRYFFRGENSIFASPLNQLLSI